MKLVILQIIVACLLSSLLLTVFAIGTWQYWVSLILIVINQVCFAVAGLPL